MIYYVNFVDVEGFDMFEVRKDLIFFVFVIGIVFVDVYEGGFLFE